METEFKVITATPALRRSFGGLSLLAEACLILAVLLCGRMSSAILDALKRTAPQASDDSPREPLEISNTVGELLHAEPNWIITDLIEEGEQVLLYGPPKVGKSQLAMQLGLAAARGKKFLRWNVTKPRRVLYINFEIGLRPFVKRVARHVLERETIPRDLDKGSVNTELEHFYFTTNARSMDVLDAHGLGEWKALISHCAPELIVYDTLSKTHLADERDNQAIKEVLLGLRKLSNKAAHVVVHHARKSPNMGREQAEMTSESIRGGSAIRGEADVILALSNRAGGAGGGKQYRLGLEARNLSGDELNLAFSGWGPFYESDTGDEISADSDAILKIFQKEKSRVLAYWILNKQLADARGILKEAASDRFNRLKKRQPELFRRVRRSTVPELEKSYPDQYHKAKQGDLVIIPEGSPWYAEIGEERVAEAS